MGGVLLNGDLWNVRRGMQWNPFRAQGLDNRWNLRYHDEYRHGHEKRHNSGNWDAVGSISQNGDVITGLELEMAGVMEIEGMQCRDLDVDMTAGEMNLNDRVLDKADSSGIHNVKMPCPERYEYDVSDSAGNVTVDDNELFGFGNHRGGLGGGPCFDIECITGTLKIKFYDKGGNNHESKTTDEGPQSDALRSVQWSCRVPGCGYDTGKACCGGLEPVHMRGSDCVFCGGCPYA
ncbi:hypothetical protein EVA_13549 [gut metagenome]|uniref:Uncharacterized protein n=1 Tax=gut metagenome TaxID=749906 RepID=J9GG74_9ZZZZ